MSMTPEEMAEFKRRRRSRNRALGLVLAALVVLFFFISIARDRGLVMIENTARRNSSASG